MCQEALFSRLHILPDLILETTTGKTMNLDPPFLLPPRDSIKISILQVRKWRNSDIKRPGDVKFLEQERGIADLGPWQVGPRAHALSNSAVLSRQLDMT